MLVRRAFLWWQFAAALILPFWVFVARGIMGASLGWDVLVFLIAAPLLGAAMLIVGVIIALRPSVLRERAVSWFDAAVLGLWHAAIVWFCIAPTTWLVVAIIGFALLAFWGGIWQFVTDASRRVAGAVRDFTVEFGAQVGQSTPAAPIDLGELPAFDDRSGTGPR